MNEAQYRRKRNADASRKKRFRTQLARVKRGEPVQSYESRWLAYLHEQLTIAHAEEA